MSRIHEALKKAAEERSAQTVNRAASDLVELSIQEEIAGKPPVNGDIQAKPRIAEKADPGQLRFEEFAKRCTHVKWKVDSDVSLYSAHSNNSVGAEKFRTLRSRLYQIASAQPLKRILITSSTPAEGKTFVAANLAQSFIMQENRRLLLFVSTLRSSPLLLHLATYTTPGLSDYLHGDVDEYQVTQMEKAGNLCLIPE